jgi:hypothetical protein
VAGQMVRRCKKGSRAAPTATSRGGLAPMGEEIGRQPIMRGGSGMTRPVLRSNDWEDGKQWPRHIGLSAIARSPTRPHERTTASWCTCCRRCWRALPNARYPAKTYEHGIKERTVVIEFDSLAQAIAAHDSPAVSGGTRRSGQWSGARLADRRRHRSSHSS